MTRSHNCSATTSRSSGRWHGKGGYLPIGLAATGYVFYVDEVVEWLRAHRVMSGSQAEYEVDM